jgi:hypothetical protein
MQARARQGIKRWTNASREGIVAVRVMIDGQNIANILV